MLGSEKLLNKYLGTGRKKKGRRKDIIFRNISKNSNQPTCLTGLSCCALSLFIFPPSQASDLGKTCL